MNIKKRVCILVFYQDNDRILFNHRRDHLNPEVDMWELLGGGIEEGEEPIDAIKREMIEELNYRLDDDRDCLRLFRKLEILSKERVFEVSIFIARYPGIEKFSDTDEVKVADLKMLTFEQSLSLPLLPIARSVVETIKKEGIDFINA